jgi:hypothetical protein
MIKEKLPREGVQFYERVYQNSYNRNQDELLAHQVAWGMTKSKMKLVDGQLICNSEDFIPSQKYVFDLEPAEQILIKNHDDGEIELDAVLATTEPRETDGKYFTEEELTSLAEQINSDGSSLPDEEHATLKRLTRSGVMNRDLPSLIGSEKGIFKTIKAVVKEGKLWVKAFLDKRYRNHAKNFKGLSIETLAKSTPSGRLVQPRYLGFTFTNTPQLAGAGIAR